MATLAEMAADARLDVRETVSAIAQAEGFRRIVRLIAKRSGVWGPVWRTDSHALASQAGMHDLGQDILDMLRVADLGAYLTMLQEEEADREALRSRQKAN